tara:strand:- start:2023 stop:2505 length:483 start_codon:yes stop_codon:yes gene_type:complete
VKKDNIDYPESFEVYWEPWIDAYSNDDFAEMEAFLNDLAIPSENEDLTEQELELMNEIASQEMFSKPLQTIMTPFGVMPVGESTLASAKFKFWTGHTNFKLQKLHLDIIDNDCEGVESVDILTPLRFRISIGKLFRDRDVMFEVREKLLEATFDKRGVTE